jgi:hypothetical protein
MALTGHVPFRISAQQQDTEHQAMHCIAVKYPAHSLIGHLHHHMILPLSQQLCNLHAAT